MLNNPQQMYLKLLQKVQLKKTEETGDLIDDKIVDRGSKTSRLRWFKMGMVQKYLKKDIYPQRKGRKLLIISD